MNSAGEYTRKCQLLQWTLQIELNDLKVSQSSRPAGREKDPSRFLRRRVRHKKHFARSAVSQAGQRPAKARSEAETCTRKRRRPFRVQLMAARTKLSGRPSAVTQRDSRTCRGCRAGASPARQGGRSSRRGHTPSAHRRCARARGLRRGRARPRCASRPCPPPSGRG